MYRYLLYTFLNGKREEYISFSCKRDFRSEALRVAEAKEAEGQTEENRNAAKVFRAFVADKTIAGKADFKRVMRALRHFDEAGLSNEIYEALEEINDAGSFEAVVFAEEGEDPTEAVERDLSAYKI